MANSTSSASVPVENFREPLVGRTVDQVLKLTRFQFREYLRSRRFVILCGIVLAIGAILTAVLAIYHSSQTGVTGILYTNLAYYGSAWGGGVDVVIVLSAVFFGGDAIAGEFQNKTGYFLMGLPIRRATVFVGKFIAAFAASLAMMGLFLVILLANGAIYFGGGFLPWQLPVSVILAVVYLLSVMGATFLFSSLFKTSAYGFVLTAILFLFGFTILQEVFVGLVKVEPWMIISYAESTVGSVFGSNVPWGFTGTKTVTVTQLGRGQSISMTTWTAGVGEGVVIMLAYFVLTTIAGLLLFEREEFS